MHSAGPCEGHPTTRAPGATAVPSMRDRVTTTFLIAMLAMMTCVPLLHSWYTTADDILIMLGLQEGVTMVGFGTAEVTGRLQHVFTGSIAPLAYAWGDYWPMRL